MGDKNSIGVGIIGTGVGLRTLLPGFHRTGRARVVALSGSSARRAQEMGSKYEIPHLTGDYRDVCISPDVSLICVASPNDLHLEHALAALETGKHVYLEKPLGLNVREAEEIADAARSRDDRLVVVGHQLRFNPYLREMHRLIGSGSIGRPYHIEIQQQGSGFADPNRSWTWEFEPERGGGVRLAMGSHLLDLASFLLGRPVSSVSASLDPVHLLRSPEGQSSRECVASNYFSALVRLGAATGFVSTTAAAHGAPRFDVRVLGDAGDLRFDPDSKLLLARRGSGEGAVLSTQVDEEYQLRQASSIFSTSFTYFADEIIAALLEGRDEVSQAATVGEAVGNMRLLDSALLSYASATTEALGGGEERPEGY